MASLIDKGGKLNVKSYNKIVDVQNKVFSNIDWAMATLNQLPTLIDGVLSLRGVAIPNALDYVFMLLGKLGLSEAEIRDFIAKCISAVLPVAEVGVKATLLANMKASISCNADPRIPKQMRKLATQDYYKDLYDAAFSQVSEERGVMVSLPSIDPFGVLELSPFREPGNTKYFDCVEDVKIHEKDAKTGKLKTVGYKKRNVPIDTLARAVDFNAFMWYTLNKGKHTSPFRAKIKGNTVIINGKTYNMMDGNKDTMLGYTRLRVDGSDCEIVQGATLVDEDNPRVLLLCIRRDLPYEGGMILNIVPVSSDWASCNWYANKDWYTYKYVTTKSGESVGFSRRDFNDDRPICNIRYISHTDAINEIRNKVSLAQNLIRNPEIFSQTTSGFRLTILPRPATFFSIPSDKENTAYEEALKAYSSNKAKGTKPAEPLSFRKKLTFNANGEYDKKGKYTLNSEDGDPVTYESYDSGYRTYKINGTNCKLKVSSSDGTVKVEGQATDLKKSLIECYGGLTVYEFNYDFIMGIKLFDAKTIIGSLFDAAKRSTFAFDFSGLFDKKAGTYASIRQSIVDVIWDTLANDDEINDCFYSFSNADYDAKLKESEQRRMGKSIYGNDYTKSNDLDLSEAYKVLEDYPTTGTLQEQKDNISLALKYACASVKSSTSGTSDGSSWWAGSGEFESDGAGGFLTNILRNLAFAMIEQILSPKVMMVLAVNRKMMGEIDDNTFRWSAKDLEAMCLTIIKPVILEIKDMIIREILDFIISKLTSLITSLYKEIAKEQLSAYLALLKLLLGWFTKGLSYVKAVGAMSSNFEKYFNSLFNSGEMDVELPTILDNVTYADIYTDNTNTEDTPTLTNC